ncbi:MAG: preprotein translocase subunit SecE [Bacteroidetes bacterium]|nr:preprotein translocase subunit SecE [Bacteroidota bacterium]
MITYLKDIYNELVYKVSWPTWKEVQSSALLVLVGVVIFSLLIFGMDISLNTVMDFIYDWK